MSDQDKDFIRADTLPARFGWSEVDSIVKRQQLLDGLKGKRVSARADNATLTRAPKPGSRVYTALPKETLEDWVVDDPAVWGSSGLYIGASRYTAKNVGDYVAVELTGLWFSLSDLVSRLGWQEAAPASDERKNAGGSPVNAEKWSNFAALLAAYAQSGGDIVPGEQAGALYAKVMDFGATLGLDPKDLLSLDTSKKALNRAMSFVQTAENPSSRD